jgi:hypothetical protein
MPASFSSRCVSSAIATPSFADFLHIRFNDGSGSFSFVKDDTPTENVHLAFGEAIVTLVRGHGGYATFCPNLETVLTWRDPVPSDQRISEGLPLAPRPRAGQRGKESLACVGGFESRLDGHGAHRTSPLDSPTRSLPRPPNEGVKLPRTGVHA